MTGISVTHVAAEAPRVTLGVRSAARSHVGLVRTINEDRIFDCPEARLWAVADGMGGHRGGDVAAQMVVDRLRALTAAGQPPGPAALLAALGAAHTDIRRYNEASQADAGATVVAALIVDDVAHIAWAGDSRAYRWRDGALDRVTRDHSLVQELVDAGLLTEQAADRHPQAHIVTRALGVHDDPRLETVTTMLAPGDRLLLCSDGLSHSLEPADMDGGAIIPLTDTLLANALARDGSDNASVILIELTR